MPLLQNTYAIATATYGRRAIFSRIANAELLLEILFRYRDQHRYALHGFAIMPDHIHVLLTPHIGQTVERCVQCIKGGFSHAVRDQFRGEVWQAGFHQHRVRDAADFGNQMNYIALDPERKHLRDYPFVHTRWNSLLDGAPEYLRA